MATRRTEAQPIPLHPDLVPKINFAEIEVEDSFDWLGAGWKYTGPMLAALVDDTLFEQSRRSSKSRLELIYKILADPQVGAGKRHDQTHRLAGFTRARCRTALKGSSEGEATREGMYFLSEFEMGLLMMVEETGNYPEKDVAAKVYQDLIQNPDNHIAFEQTARDFWTNNPAQFLKGLSWRINHKDFGAGGDHDLTDSFRTLLNFFTAKVRSYQHAVVMALANRVVLSQIQKARTLEVGNILKEMYESLSTSMTNASVLKAKSLRDQATQAWEDASKGMDKTQVIPLEQKQTPTSEQILRNYWQGLVKKLKDKGIGVNEDFDLSALFVSQARNLMLELARFSTDAEEYQFKELKNPRVLAEFIEIGEEVLFKAIASTNNIPVKETLLKVWQDLHVQELNPGQEQRRHEWRKDQTGLEDFLSIFVKVLEDPDCGLEKDFSLVTDLRKQIDVFLDEIGQAESGQAAIQADAWHTFEPVINKAIRFISEPPAKKYLAELLCDVSTRLSAAGKYAAEQELGK